MTELKRDFQDLQAFVRKGATLVDVWELILKTPRLKDLWKDVFGYQEKDFVSWAFLLKPKQRKYINCIEEYFEKDLLTIHWRDLAPLLPNALQRSLSHLNEEFSTEDYYERFFRQSLGAKPY